MSEAVATPVTDDSPLAVICGGGSLPFAVADAVGKRGRRVVLFAIRGLGGSATRCRLSASLGGIRTVRLVLPRLLAARAAKM